jgi:uncharacterized protein (DUF58 family)
VTASLLDPSFLRELEVLRRHLRVRARAGGHGEGIARRRGGSAEFLEHRPYAPGDDLRRVDWLAFARTGEPVQKLFVAEEDTVLRLLVDTSGSLDAGAPTKLDVLRRLVACVGFMALASSDRAQVIAARAETTRAREPVRGRAGVAGLLRDLESLTAEGGTALAESIDETVRRAARPGLLVVASDFLDPGPFERAVTRAAAAGHDVALLQVLSPEELEPPYDGDYALEDAETGAVVSVTIDARTRAAYLAQLEALFERLRALARRVGAPYVRTTPAEPPLLPVRRLLARAVD